MPYFLTRRCTPVKLSVREYAFKFVPPRVPAVVWVYEASSGGFTAKIVAVEVVLQHSLD